MRQPLRTASAPAKVARYWHGDAPDTCNTCHRPVGGEFVDGKTAQGPWGIMCSACHRGHGVGFGTGKGQRYSLQSDGGWLDTTPTNGRIRR